MYAVDDPCSANDIPHGKPYEQGFHVSPRLMVFIIVDIVAAYWLYSRAHPPGSTELYIAIGCLLVSVVATYLGFVRFRDTLIK